MRVFLAAWPDARTRTAIADAMRQYLSDSDGRMVAAEKLHMTLVFIGEVDEDGLQRLGVAMDGLEVPRTVLTLERTGYFDRARVAWLGPAETPDALAGSVAELRARVRSAGLPVDERPFKPHVTVMRPCRRPPPDWEGPAIRWPIDEVTLVCSESGRYTVVGTYPSARSDRDGVR